MTGVCFPLEFGIVGSRLRVQERRILFKKLINFLPKLILIKQRGEVKSFSKTKFGSRRLLNSITWVKHKINSGFEVVVVLSFIWFYEMTVISILGK